MQERKRFIIIGSGFRTLYYVRIAKALSKNFELCAMLCRSEEKAKKIANEYDIVTTTSEEECISYKPDFVVVSVSKASGYEVATHWMDLGFCTLLETPAALEIENLNDLWHRHNNGQKVVVCEQYFKYPILNSLIKISKSGILGQKTSLNISITQEYHALSLAREFLEIPTDQQFVIRAKTYSFPTTATLTRYEKISENRVFDSKRTISTIEFTNGQVVFYDYDNELNRSPIRKKTLMLQGSRGEIINDKVYFLDCNNNAIQKSLEIKTNVVQTNSENPNFKNVIEVTNIDFNDENLYKPHFGVCSLSQDESAIALMMEGTALYAKGLGESPYPLEKALQDAYGAILMRRAIETGNNEKSEKQIWNK